MRRERQAVLAQAVGVAWPLLCAVTTVSTLALVGRFLPAAHGRAEETLWWADAALAVAGSVTAGLYSARDHERVRAAVAFAAWAAFLTFVAFNFYAMYFMSERR
jgi:hypothetical protein